MLHKSDSTNHPDKSPSNVFIAHPLPQYLSIFLTLAIVVIIREVAVVFCQMLGFVSAANIVGMVALFLILIAWRYTLGLPEWMTRASNTLLVDSGFAFLPVSAGAGMLLFTLGDEFWGIMLTIVVSTLLPLWGLAHLSQIWLNHHDQSFNDADDLTHGINKKHVHLVTKDNHDFPDDK